MEVALDSEIKYVISKYKDIAHEIVGQIIERKSTIEVKVGSHSFTLREYLSKEDFNSPNHY